jgi:hypothetical protein
MSGADGKQGAAGWMRSDVAVDSWSGGFIDSNCRLG